MIDGAGVAEAISLGGVVAETGGCLLLGLLFGYGLNRLIRITVELFFPPKKDDRHGNP